MAVVMAAPVVHLGVRAAQAEDPVGFAVSDRVRTALVDTLLLAVVVTGLAVLIGVALAWLVERTDVPGRRTLGLVATVPIVIPTYLAAATIRDAFGPRPLLLEVPGLLGFGGAAVALVVSTYPYVLLLARASLATSDPALEEAARSLGDSSRAVLRRVVLPALRPAMAAGGLLVFLYVLSDFGAVAILDFRTLTVLIYAETRTSFELTSAAVVGVMLVLLTLAVVVVERLLRGRPAPVRAHSGQRPAAVIHLGRWRWPAAAAVCLPAALGAGLPLAVLSYRAFIAEGRSDSAGVLVDAALTSVGLSAAAAIVAVVIALPVALLAVRHRSAFSTTAEGLAVSGYALPGLVVALALVFLATRFTPWLYSTLALVVVAYVVRFLPEALGAVRSSLTRIDPAVEEAARSLGRRPPAVLATVTLPMLRGGLLAGGALVFLTSMKELPATLLLQPPGYDTLATRVWTGANEGFFSQAAPPGLLIVAVSALALLPVRRLATRAGDETRETHVVPS